MIIMTKYILEFLYTKRGGFPMKKEDIKMVQDMLVKMQDGLTVDVGFTINEPSEEGLLVTGVIQGKNFKTALAPGLLISNDSLLMPRYNSMRIAYREGRTAPYQLSENGVNGEPIAGAFIPYFDDDGEVVLVIGTMCSTRRQDAIVNYSESLEESLQQTEESIQEIANDSQELAATLGKIQELSDNVEKEMSEIAKLIAAIQGNASRSNILALNAAIESARAGEAGKGFAVVADEMGKLAKASGDSAKRIKESLDSMFSELKNVSVEVGGANNVASSQAAAVEEITATVASITESATRLSALAKNQ